MRPVLMLACALLATTAAAEPADNPLASFAGFVGGRWYLEDSYMELEWGVGQRSVSARSYFTVNGESKLVSEGFWYWHPGERRIRGTFTAIDMPVVLFLYMARFEGDTMIGDLVAYGPNGKETKFVETWKLEDEARFTWKLSSETPDGQELSMDGTYIRR